VFAYPSAEGARMTEPPSSSAGPPAGPPDRVADGGPAVPRSRRPAVTATVAVLLTVQVVALLAVGTYAKTGPRLGGFPFFYWYTLLWLLIGAACMALCAALTRDRPRDPGDAR